MRGFWLIGLALFAAGCAEEEREVAPYRLWVSPTFSVEKQAAVVRAAESWNQLSGRTAVVVESVGERDHMIVVPRTFPVDGVDAQGLQAEHGVLLVADDRYTCDGVDGTDDIRCFEALVKHEIGHLLGVPHVHRGIMQEFNVALDFSDEDRAACASATYCAGLTSRR